MKIAAIICFVASVSSFWPWLNEQTFELGWRCQYWQLSFEEEQLEEESNRLTDQYDDLTEYAEIGKNAAWENSPDHPRYLEVMRAMIALGKRQDKLADKKKDLGASWINHYGDEVRAKYQREHPPK